MNWNLLECIGKVGLFLALLILAVMMGWCIYKDWRRGAFMALGFLLLAGAGARAQTAPTYANVTGTMVSPFPGGVLMRCANSGYLDPSNGIELPSAPVPRDAMFVLKGEPGQDTLTDGQVVAAVVQLVGVVTYTNAVGGQCRVPVLQYVAEQTPIQTTPPAPRPSSRHHSMDELSAGNL